MTQSDVETRLGKIRAELGGLADERKTLAGGPSTTAEALEALDRWIAEMAAGFAPPVGAFFAGERGHLGFNLLLPPRVGPGPLLHYIH